ncbi:MAG TPA: hypothetical protein VNH46_07550, partial [Gemmatimonadales bacterium]|nr:hypothetical protein [Gemmatimonadales bacterium]
ACVEVVNAAVAGLSLPGVQELWENWASRFRPAVVVVYPSPAFYLSNRGPSAPAPVRSSSVIQDRRPWRPRLWQRAKDAFEFPEFIQRRRLAAALEAATASHDSTWFFREVPQDRLERYRADLTSLTRSITARGARPVLVTHAMRFHIPPTPDEMPILNGWRRFTPRALPTVMLEFEVAAARVTGQVARSEEVPLVDAAGRLSAHPGWFADFAHFTDEGAAVMAGLLADSLARVIPLR